MDSATASEVSSCISMTGEGTPGKLNGRQARHCGGLVAAIKRFPLVHILLFISFFLSSLFINFCQLALWCSLRPLSLNLFRRVNRYLNYAVWSQVAFLVEWWSNSKTIIDSDCDAVAGKRHAVIIMNHSHDNDGQVAWGVCDYYDILGNSKALAKKELLLFPVIGWTWFFAEAIFIDRDWSKDQVLLKEKIDSLLSCPEPFWLLLYPEGTRFTDAKHAASVEFSRANNQPVLENVLFPRTKGFVFLRERMKGETVDILDVTTMVGQTDAEAERTNIGTIFRGEPVTSRMLMRRFSLDDVPEDEEGAKQWLINLFVEKDAFMKYYKEHGEFMSEAEKREKNMKTFEVERTWACFCNTVFWIGLVHSLLWSYLASCLAHGSVFMPGLLVLFLFVASFGMRRMMSLTSRKQGSSYGAKTSSKKTKRSKKSAKLSKTFVTRKEKLSPQLAETTAFKSGGFEQPGEIEVN